MNIRDNFEIEKKSQNGRFALGMYKHLPLFFQVPSYPFFMMMDGGYSHNILRTLWGFSLPSFSARGSELLFYLGSSRWRG